jgi:hypothetical protein
MEETKLLNLKFNKFIIRSDGKFNFILEEIKTKGNKNWYYSDLLSLLKAIPNKIILKSEAMSVWELTCELEKVYDELKELNKVLSDAKKT